MLKECISCLKTAKQKTWEVIVVDDGSKGLGKVIQFKVSQSFGKISTLTKTELRILLLKFLLNCWKREILE